MASTLSVVIFGEDFVLLGSSSETVLVRCFHAGFNSDLKLFWFYFVRSFQVWYVHDLLLSLVLLVVLCVLKILFTCKSIRSCSL